MLKVCQPTNSPRKKPDNPSEARLPQTPQSYSENRNYSVNRSPQIMFLKSVQNLSEKKRKIILWLIVVIIGGILLFFWLRSFQGKLQGLKKEDIMDKISLPSLEEVSE